MNIKTVAVFAGSSHGNDPAYGAEMLKLGQYLAALNVEVWTGGCVGMTQSLAEGILIEGGRMKVHQPPHYRNGEAFPGNIQVVTVPSDHERTVALLKADAWITGPGSAGTIGETVRGITWNLDRTYRKDRPLTPHFIMNVNNMHASLIGAYQSAVDHGFGSAQTMQLFTVVKDAEGVMRGLRAIDGRPSVVLNRVSCVAKPAMP